MGQLSFLKRARRAPSKEGPRLRFNTTALRDINFRLGYTQVIFSRTSEYSEQDIREKIADFGLQLQEAPERIDVPAFSPRIYDEFLSWKELWPITYHSTHERYASVSLPRSATSLNNYGSNNHDPIIENLADNQGSWSLWMRTIWRKHLAS